MPSLSAFSWTPICWMFRSVIIELHFRMNSTENWNSDQKKDKLDDGTFWTLKVLLSQMETNLNFVLLAQFYIPMCTKLKCSSLLSWNKDEVLKSFLEKILQLMYAYSCWSTNIHTAEKSEHIANPAISWSREGRFVWHTLYPGVVTLHILTHQKTWCNITKQQRAFTETSFWWLSMLFCVGQQCFKEAVKYSSCFSFGADVEIRGKDATERYKNRGLKKNHPYMMSIELPLNTAALSDSSFLFKG